MRIVVRSNEFDDFYSSLPEKVQSKLDYALVILREVAQRIIKNLE